MTPAKCEDRHVPTKSEWQSMWAAVVQLQLQVEALEGRLNAAADVSAGACKFEPPDFASAHWDKFVEMGKYMNGPVRDHATTVPAAAAVSPSAKAAESEAVAALKRLVILHDVEAENGDAWEAAWATAKRITDGTPC